MKAVVFHGPHDFRYEDYSEPKLSSERDLIIRVCKCSICGSDLHMYNGKQLGPIDYSQVKIHFCVGHEAIGEVVEVGRAVTRHKPGDRILLAGGVGCGKCRQCQRGAFSLCEKKSVLPYGFSPMLEGLQAEYACVKQADLSALTIPEGVTDEQALLLTDSLATGFLGAVKAGVVPGSTVAVIGQGPIGKTAMESAFALGAEKVFVIEPSEFRRAIAAQHGAIPLTPEAAQSVILQETGGLGVGCTIEAVGRGDSIKQAIRITRAGGQLAILGLITSDTRLALTQAQLKSLTIFAGVAGVADSWPQLVPLVQQGLIKGDGMFTHHFPLSQASDAFALFNTGQDTVMKVMIEVAR